jgi:hypothetical protein
MKEKLLEIQKEALSSYPIKKDKSIPIKREDFKSFNGVNIEMLDFFINAKSPIEFIEFERWLLKIWKIQN